MTASITDLRHFKARRIALRKFESLCELAEELEAVDPDHLDEVCAEYEAQGWASAEELRAARRLV
jgi:hypothetical protein